MQLLELDRRVQVVRVSVELIEQIGKIGGRAPLAWREVGRSENIIVFELSANDSWGQKFVHSLWQRELPAERAAFALRERRIGVPICREVMHRFMHGRRQIELGIAAGDPAHKEFFVLYRLI